MNTLVTVQLNNLYFLCVNFTLTFEKTVPKKPETLKMKKSNFNLSYETIWRQWNKQKQTIIVA